MIQQLPVEGQIRQMTRVIVAAPAKPMTKKTAPTVVELLAENGDKGQIIRVEDLDLRIVHQRISATRPSLTEFTVLTTGQPEPRIKPTSVILYSG